MSRSVKNDCVTSEHVNFWLCTNPLMRLFWVWCGGSFQGSREEDDILWSRRVKSLSLGVPPWFIPGYYKKTQASKLGDAQGIPFFIDKLSGSFSWIYIFIRTHLMYFTWSVCVLLFFVFVWINSDPSILYMGERHAPLFHMNTGVLSFTFNVHGEGSNCSVHCYLVGNRKCFMW